MNDGGIRSGPHLELTAVEGLGRVGSGDDLSALLLGALGRAGLRLLAGDVLAVASKVVSRAEGRFVDLSTVEPGAEAWQHGARTGRDPRLIELVLRESLAVVRVARGVLIVKNRHGIVCANGGIDASNARPADAPPGSGPWVLLLPEDPGGSAGRILADLEARFGSGLGVVITDSIGRPFRLGTTGVAVGTAGLPPLDDHCGRLDLDGRPLEHTVTGLADAVAAAADLVAGQSSEGRAAVVVRGLVFPRARVGAEAVVRPPDTDLFLRG